MPSRLADDAPRATPGFDASEGLVTTLEAAGLFGVEQKTVQRWARAAIKAAASGREPAIPVMRTEGGDWRLSRKWVREQQGGGDGEPAAT